MCSWVQCLRQWVEMLSWFLFIFLFKHVLTSFPNPCASSSFNITRTLLSLKFVLLTDGFFDVWLQTLPIANSSPHHFSHLFFHLLFLFTPCFSSPCLSQSGTCMHSGVKGHSWTSNIRGLCFSNIKTTVNCHLPPFSFSFLLVNTYRQGSI